MPAASPKAPSDCAVEEPDAERTPEAQRAAPQEAEPEAAPATPTADPEPRRTRAAKALAPSATAWVSRRRLADDEDSRIVRSLKSLLNKLTVEKFPLLYEQLLGIGVRTPGQVEALVQEVFEKATMQHHFIDMYADLCSLLHEHFASHSVSEDKTFSFKRVLLAECQASFERHLTPPEGLKDIEDFDERSVAEHRYKTRMLGTIRFVGALVVRRMLATKVMFTICFELLGAPTGEALESLAALLTVVGPEFDRKAWSGRASMTGIFYEIDAIIKGKQCDARARCLLQDVVELRAGGWQARVVKRAEGPMKLDEVAQRAGARLPEAPRAPEAPFDRALFRAAVRGLAEEGFEAVAERLAELPPPPAGQQPGEVSFVLREVAREPDASVRRAGFAVVTRFFYKGQAGTGACWEAAALAEGIRKFSVRRSLLEEVPALPEIVKRELLPALKPLKVGGIVSKASLEHLELVGAA